VHLAEALVELGCRVDIVDNFSRGTYDARLERLISSGVQLFEQDLRTSAPMVPWNSYSHVFHLAGIVGVSAVASRPWETLRDNVGMFAQVIEALRDYSPKTVLVYFSSSEIHLGAESSGALPLPTPESAPVVVAEVANVRASYMLSKLHSEALCAHSGLRHVILRPHNIYGPRMGTAHVIPQLILRLASSREGQRLVIRSPAANRCFCYIDDAVDQIVAAASTDRCHGQTLNIGNASEEIQIIELAEIIRSKLNREVDLEPGEHERDSPMRRLPDLSKIRCLVAITAQIPLSQGLEWTIEYYLPRGEQQDLTRALRAPDRP
jgi:nucleoside-diphosphate-sugar epimerase